MISQGTQSVIGWTGVLLDRLHEVYSHEEQPREQSALVLIDEIGAHMHPLWQQTIVPGLKELFPNVQFIATSHSPLRSRTAQPGVAAASRPLPVFGLSSTLVWVAAQRTAPEAPHLPAVQPAYTLPSIGGVWAMGRPSVVF